MFDAHAALRIGLVQRDGASLLVRTGNGPATTSSWTSRTGMGGGLLCGLRLLEVSAHV